MPHTLTQIRDNSNKVYIIPGRNRDPVLYSAGAPCRGTVCHTHSLRSGTTDKVNIPGNDIRDSGSVLHSAEGNSLPHTLSEIRDNSDKVNIYIYQAMTSAIRDSVLHSAGAPYSGTVCHTHSVRSGATLTRFIAL